MPFSRISLLHIDRSPSAPSRSGLLFALLLFGSGPLRAQLPQRPEYNQLDAQGLKMGYWMFYYSWGGLAAQGEYVRDRKVGEWRYYFNGDHDVSSVERTVTYLPSGGFVETGPEAAYVLQVSADSAQVVGLVNGFGFAPNQKPCITCRKKGGVITCRRLSPSGQTLYTYLLSNTATLFQIVRGQFCNYQPAP